jgi:hypothetical protein
MSMTRIRPAALAAAAALAFAAPAMADPQAAVDAPMSTSSASPQVAQQIQAFIDSSPAAARPDPNDELPLPDRKVHGEVSVSVGNHGYRSAYARSDMPVGKTGTLSVAVGESRGRGYWGGERRQQSLALGLDFSGAPREGVDCRDRSMFDASRRYSSTYDRLCRPGTETVPGVN